MHYLLSLRIFLYIFLIQSPNPCALKDSECMKNYWTVILIFSVFFFHSLERILLEIKHCLSQSVNSGTQKSRNLCFSMNFSFCCVSPYCASGFINIFFPFVYMCNCGCRCSCAVFCIDMYTNHSVRSMESLCDFPFSLRGWRQVEDTRFNRIAAHWIIRWISCEIRKERMLNRGFTPYI